MRIVDGRRYAGVGMRETLRVCMQCGACWQRAGGASWLGKIEHVGPHDPKLREYRRVSAWPCAHLQWRTVRTEFGGVCMIRACTTCGRERPCLSG